MTNKHSQATGSIPAGIEHDTSVPFGSGDQSADRYRLSNGLTLIFVEDHSAPVFSFQMWYKVGSSHEHASKTGLAHFFEHLMFKGTEKHPEGEFDRLMERRGAQTNAGTWLDWTFYYENLPAGLVPDADGTVVDRGRDNFATVAEFEADRMQHLRVEEGPFRSELEVVKNERLLRVDNDPEGRMDEELWALAYDEHPYHWPTIGWMKHLDRMNLEDAQKFYKNFYAPNRATMVIVGDVDRQFVLETIAEHFGPIPSQDVQIPTRTYDPPQQAERRKTLSLPLAHERALIGYHVPGLNHDDLPALDVLCEIIFNSDSSRAEKVLVHETETALDVSGWVGPFQDPSLMQMTLNCQTGKKAEEALQLLDNLLEELRTTGVKESEVQRAINKIKMSMLRSMLAAHSRAYQLGFYETTSGDFQNLFQYMERVVKISATDILRVARAYLEPRNRAIIIGLPDEGSGARTDGPAAQPSARGPLFHRPELAAPVEPASDLEALGGSTRTLNGLDCILVEAPEVPHIAFVIEVHCGSIHDPPNKEGLAYLVGEMLFRGTQAYDREQLAEALDAIGCSLRVRIRKNMMTLQGDVASEHLDTFVGLISEILFRPTFPETEFEKLKRQTASEIRSISDDDSALARRGFSRMVFQDHPWARPTMGTEETVQNLCLDDIVSFYETCFRPAYANIGVSGDISVQRFEELVESQFADHTFSSIRPKVSLPAPRTLSGQTIILMDKPERSQTQVLLGHTTVPAGHSDMVPLTVSNTAFGGTFTSRLMQEVRVKRGWSYGAYSGFSVGRELSTYHVNFYPKTEDTVPALKLVLDLIQTLTEEGLPEEELEFARSYRVNAYPFSLETHPKRLALLMNARYLDRPADWVIGHIERTSGVTTDQVGSALEAHVSPDNLVIAITCTADDILEDVKELPGVREVWVQAYDQPWEPKRVYSSE